MPLPFFNKNKNLQPRVMSSILAFEALKNTTQRAILTLDMQTFAQEGVAFLNAWQRNMVESLGKQKPKPGEQQSADQQLLWEINTKLSAAQQHKFFTKILHILQDPRSTNADIASAIYDMQQALSEITKKSPHFEALLAKQHPAFMEKLLAYGPDMQSFQEIPNQQAMLLNYLINIADSLINTPSIMMEDQLLKGLGEKKEEAPAYLRGLEMMIGLIEQDKITLPEGKDKKEVLLALQKLKSVFERQVKEIDSESMNTTIRTGLETINSAFEKVFTTRFTDAVTGVSQQITPTNFLGFLKTLAKKMAEANDKTWKEIDTEIKNAEQAKQENKGKEENHKPAQQKAAENLLNAKASSHFKMLAEDEDAILVLGIVYHSLSLQEGSNESKVTAMYDLYRLFQIIGQTDKEDKNEVLQSSTFWATMMMLNRNVVGFLQNNGPKLDTQLSGIKKEGGLIDALVKFGETSSTAKLKHEDVLKQLNITNPDLYRRGLDIVSHLVEAKYIELDPSRRAKVMTAIELLKPVLSEKSSPKPRL
jgi:hypothetical protein